MICTLNEENQFLKARLLTLEKSFLKITYNVDKDKEPSSSVYKAKSIDKAAVFHASEQSNKSDLSSINTKLLNTSHDNSLARQNNNGQCNADDLNNNGQCNADDLNNNQIDLANVMLYFTQNSRMKIICTKAQIRTCNRNRSSQLT